jgi:chitinase
MSNSTRLVGYYAGYAAKSQNYPVADIPAQQLTHVIYAFAGVSSGGQCVSQSPHEDKTNFPQLFQLKQNYPTLKTLISVGGANQSANFPCATDSPTARRTLAQSCVQFMKKNGFDGIDIDWEFPAAAETQSFTDLLRELRHALDEQGTADSQHYLLTIAAPAGPEHYQYIDLPQTHPLLDWINLMTYDFYTTASKRTNFVAPLYASPFNPESSRSTHCVDAAVKAYLAACVPPEKIVMGVRFVATSWKGVADINNGLYQTDDGAGPGTWDEAGSLGYQDLEHNYFGGYSQFRSNECKVPWLYNPGADIMISYEDPGSLREKTKYAAANQLGGIMIWELAADDEQHSLLNAIAGEISGVGTAAAGSQSGSYSGLRIAGAVLGIVGALWAIDWIASRQGWRTDSSTGHFD